jgi:integrase
MVTPDNLNSTGWKLISQCKICIDNDQPYFPDDRLGVERAIDEFGERGFEQAKSYYEDYVPVRSREDSWDRPAISWPSRPGLSKGELELLRGEIIRQGSPTCRRDLAILDVAYSAGLDLKRLSNLTIRDIRNNWFAIWLGGRYQYTGEMRTRNISWKARWSLKGYCTGSRKQMVSKGFHPLSWYDHIFVAEDGKPMTGSMMLTMLRDYATGVGITTGIGVNTFAVSRGRHMLEDGYTMRRARQFFRDSSYPEAETGDYNDQRSLVTCSYSIDPVQARR